jgi:hypothetical protein
MKSTFRRFAAFGAVPVLLGLVVSCMTPAPGPAPRGTAATSRPMAMPRTGPQEGIVLPVVGTGPSAPIRFSFIAFGCMPYGRDALPAYRRLLEEINYHRPAFAVHLGDLKKGSEPPTEAWLQENKAYFNSLNGALIYTPGDNEWTDVHQASNLRQDPGIWLTRIRALFFAEEKSLGRAPIDLITQRRDAGFEKFVENARWSRAGVTFATVHVVGSNNNYQPAVPGAVAEFRERDAANVAWVKSTFSTARAEGAIGVVLLFQAEPINKHRTPPAGVESGFTQFLTTVEAEARSYGKPVLLVHADEHRYRYETNVRLLPDREPLANVSRLETFGENDVHGVVVIVDPASPQLFLAGPLVVPMNPLPVLPKK